MNYYPNRYLQMVKNWHNDDRELEFDLSFGSNLTKVFESQSIFCNVSPFSLFSIRFSFSFSLSNLIAKSKSTTFCEVWKLFSCSVCLLCHSLSPLHTHTRTHEHFHSISLPSFAQLFYHQRMRMCQSTGRHLMLAIKYSYCLLLW